MCLTIEKGLYVQESYYYNGVLGDQLDINTSILLLCDFEY